MRMIDPAGHTKLNLGSGKDYRTEYLNVDISPIFKPDVVADMTEITFPPDSFTEIIMFDCIDHIDQFKARRLARFMLKWMKPGGQLSLHLPNLQHLAYILYTSDNDELRNEALKWIYGSDGKGTTNYESNRICWAYDKRAIKTLLEDVGFAVLSVKVDCFGFGLTVVGVKKK